MEFGEVIRGRYSCRSYRAQQVPKEALDACIAAFVQAPTAANRQPFGLVILRTAGRSDELARVYSSAWFHSQPPLVLAVCADVSKAWRRSKDGQSYAMVDAAIAMDHLVLAATEQGLGTCWIAAFDPDEARKVLALPENVETVAFTPLGYPADEPTAKLRKSPKELVHWERW
ncbi:MAG: nitroreductase family protein [Anaerolineae bacterium]|nr:nitroreductase family protein [Anaerolineae bacterium]